MSGVPPNFYLRPKGPPMSKCPAESKHLPALKEDWQPIPKGFLLRPQILMPYSKWKAPSPTMPEGTRPPSLNQPLPAFPEKQPEKSAPAAICVTMGFEEQMKPEMNKRTTHEWTTIGQKMSSEKAEYWRK